MNTRLPTLQEIEALLAFLPRLQAQKCGLVQGWHDGSVQTQDAILVSFTPVYSDVVQDFFRIAAGECWMDRDYQPEEAGRMLDDHEAVRTADLAGIRAMLTYCVRGERFCDGHWAAMIRDGHIARLLERLAELKSGMTA